MIRYLADSSALWRMLRDAAVRAAWADVISDHAIGSCQPQRTEFRRSARNLDEYEQMTAMFIDLYPDVAGAQDGLAVGRVSAVPAVAGRDAPGAVLCRSPDLRLCGRAWARGPARRQRLRGDRAHLPDLAERRVLAMPAPR